MKHKISFLSFLVTPGFWVFSLWLAIGLSTTYWVLQVLPTKEAPEALIVDSGTTQVDTQIRKTQLTLTPNFASLFTGNDQKAIARAKERLNLIGVVAQDTGYGAALIAIDNNIAKTFRVGQIVIDPFVLLSVSPRKAHLDGFVLEMQVDPGAVSGSGKR